MKAQSPTGVNGPASKRGAYIVRSNMVYYKNHSQWIKVKQKLDTASENIYVRAGEIR